ncbi:PTS transporter subunit EIIC [Staphylococcus aureus]
MLNKPVAILPAAAIIAGIGNTLNALHATPKIAMSTTVGTTILEQLGILFAIGVAIGMARKMMVQSRLATLGYFLVTVVLSPMKLAPLLGMKASEINSAFEKMNNGNVFVGIVIGLIAAYAYNKFSETELPLALSFFSGKRISSNYGSIYCTFLSCSYCYSYGHYFIHGL